MSNAVVTAAYKTRIGNSTAKSVLALLADTANNEGFCFPSNEFIAKQTEISLRQVQRIVQIFGRIGLVARFETKTQQYDHYFVINLAMLGRDVSTEFSAEHALLQGKRLGDAEEGVSETQVDVSETQADVSETLTGVCETLPPHPLIGVTVIEPSGEPSREPARAVPPPATSGITLLPPPPPGRFSPGSATPVTPSPVDLSDLVADIVCAHPRAVLRQWGPLDVPWAEKTQVLDAITAECAKTGCTQAEAGNMILERVRFIADKVPRGEWRYLKQPGEFMRLREYRMEPEEFTRTTSTTAPKTSFAEDLHAREQDEIRALRRKRAENGRGA